MRDDEFFIEAMSNWLTLHKVINGMDEQELLYCYRMECKVRRRKQIMDRIHKKLSKIRKEKLRDELSGILREYETD